MDNKNVLVIGELNVDVLLNGIRGFPVIGQEILADEMLVTLGSSSAIFAANLSALGVATSFCGMVGKDLFGQLVLTELAGKGVNCELIKESSAHKTGVTMILNYGQDRANITHCGAMDHFSYGNIPVERLSRFSHLHLSSFFLQKSLRKDIVRLFRTAKDYGLTTSIDLQWDPANAWDFPFRECLPAVDLFMPNESEILSLTGTQKLSDALELLDPFANTIVVKMGISGSVAYQKGVYKRAPAFLHDHFIDAIGAGDSFNAGFISSYLQGRTLHECLISGNLTGAINTTAAGGTGAFSDPASFVKKAKSLFDIEI